MAVLEQEIRQAPELIVRSITRHLFSRADYHAMAFAGILTDQRVELIEGEIIDMSPIGLAHAALTDPLAELLRSAFGAGFTVRTQMPIALGDDRTPSEPQPDIAVVIGIWRDYIARHPQAQDIRLVVEVSDSSLNFDRKAKSALYAAARIPEYWIVNLVDNCLEVYRDPDKAAYGPVTVYKIGDHVNPLHAQTGRIAVTDFLP